MGAQKAWVAAAVTLIGVPLAMIFGTDMPTPTSIEESLRVVLTALAAAAATGAGAYFKRNVPK